MSPLVLNVLGAIVLVLVIVALSAIRVVQQYERGVIFVLGRLIGAKGPGLFLVPPFISRMMKVDLRIVTLTVPPQEVITHDNVTIRVTAVIYFYVVQKRLSRYCIRTVSVIAESNSSNVLAPPMPGMAMTLRSLRLKPPSIAMSGTCSNPLL